MALSIAAWSSCVVPAYWSDERLLVVELLLRDQVAGAQRPVTLEVEACVAQLGGIPHERRFRVVESNLKRARVDLREEVPFVDDLPLLEVHADEGPVDQGFHVHRRDRRHGAETFEPDGHVLLKHRRDGDGDGAVGLGSGCPGGGRRGDFGRVRVVVDGAPDETEAEHGKDPPARVSGLRARRVDDLFVRVRTRVRVHRHGLPSAVRSCARAVARLKSA